MNKICFPTLKGKGNCFERVNKRGRESEIGRERGRGRSVSNIFPFFPVRPETLSAVKEWLKQLPSQGLEAVDCGSYTLDEPQICCH